MRLHEARRSPARRIDDIQLLQGLLTQRLYVNEHDRRLLHLLLAETPRQPQKTQRATRRGARRLRAGGAALALSGALALALGSPLLPAVAASSQPATWIAAADRATDNLAQPADDALLRELLNRAASTNRQTVAPADQAAPPTDDALAQAALTAGETLIIPAAQVAANASTAAPTDSVEQQAASYYVVQPGDTLSGIAQFYYGNSDLWPIIFKANPDKILDPQWIYPNQQLLIPPAGITGMAVAITPAAGITGMAVANTSPATQSGRGLGQYIVQPGDTLMQIAAYAYGNGSSWWGIYQANIGQINNPDLIYPGQVLTIP